MDQFARRGYVNVSHASHLARTALQHFRHFRDVRLNTRATHQPPESHNFQILMRRHLCSLSCCGSETQATYNKSTNSCIILGTINVGTRFPVACKEQFNRRSWPARARRTADQSCNTDGKSRKLLGSHVTITEAAREPNPHGANPAHPLTV